MMRVAPPHPRELDRLISVREHLESAGWANPVLVALVEAAARELGTSMAALSLIGEDLQVFQATVGMEGTSRPRSGGMCAWVVARDAVVEVPDLLKNLRFGDGTAAEFGVRFYAGAPVYDTCGLPIGVLCVFDVEPRSMSVADRVALEQLAESVSAQFELLRLRARGQSRRTALRQASQQLRLDPVTGLPNADLLADRLGQALAESARTSGHVGVCVLALDRLRRVNDSRGHAAGDAVLRAVADRIAEQLRAGDTLARFYSDQYVVVWRDLTSPDQVESLHQRLLTVFDVPFDLDGSPIEVTASLGVATGAAPRLPDELLLEAETAMQAAKVAGPGQSRIFTPELHRHRTDRLRTEVELRRALDRDELVLHYQPVVDLAGGRVVGVEALVRWQHPTDGLVMPDAFIPVAESSGLIVRLGAWVIEQACEQAMVWERAGRQLNMAVNLSVRQVTHPGLVPTLQRALAGSGLPADRLIVEVTESAVVDDAKAAVVALRAIDALGVSVAIDDFGTGYSSLHYLKHYPITVLKIDRSFVAGLVEHGDDAAIVASLISLARAVGSVCIAEGIETATQYQRLVAMGCQYAQGYLFSRPVAAQDLLAAVDLCEQRLFAAGPRRLPAQRRRRPVGPLSSAAAARLLQLHDEGASRHTIAAALNHEGLPHPDHVRWHPTFVAHHLAADPTRSRSAEQQAVDDDGRGGPGR